MARWHIPMIFANLALSEDDTKKVLSTLYRLLDDPSDFVKNWSISSLCIIGKRDGQLKSTIVKKLRVLKSSSRMVNKRVEMALDALENDKPIPKGWQKRGMIR
jgi:hypothetical protein